MEKLATCQRLRVTNIRAWMEDDKHLKTVAKSKTLRLPDPIKTISCNLHANWLFKCHAQFVKPYWDFNWNRII